MFTVKVPHRRDRILVVLKQGLAEFISTFIFVFAGSGSVIAFNKLNGNDAAEKLISSAVAHAFSLFAAVSVSTNISGGHVNPAITFGLFIGGNVSVFRLVIYWTAQLLGSIVACLVLWLVTGVKSIPSYGLSIGAGVGNAVVWEMVMTFGLVYTVYAAAIDPKSKSDRKNKFKKSVKKGCQMNIELDKTAPLVVGFMVGANILAGGTTMNPVMSFGPSVICWSWANHWAYWVGPLIGAGLTGLIYEMSCISQTHEEDEPEKSTDHY